MGPLKTPQIQFLGTLKSRAAVEKYFYFIFVKNFVFAKTGLENPIRGASPRGRENLPGLCFWDGERPHIVDRMENGEINYSPREQDETMIEIFGGFIMMSGTVNNIFTSEGF